MKYGILFLVPLVLLSCEPGTHSEPGNAEASWWTEEDRQFILDELDRTTAALEQEINGLESEKWHFREDSSRWSIGEIVEHLEMQNQLHFREISVVANAPQYLQYRAITEGQDPYFSNYATDATPGKAQWFLEPLGRFPTKEAGWNAFSRARGNLRLFVQNTTVDLRKQFTYRTPVEGKAIKELKPGQVRDLHQLLLTGIAHTDRHLSQIRKIKEHKKYPK